MNDDLYRGLRVEWHGPRAYATCPRCRKPHPTP